jgi:hypothetical protein
MIIEGDQAEANRWLRGVLTRIWIDNRQLKEGLSISAKPRAVFCRGQGL